MARFTPSGTHVAVPSPSGAFAMLCIDSELSSRGALRRCPQRSRQLQRCPTVQAVSVTTSLTGTRREAPHRGEGGNLALEHGQAHRALALGCPIESTSRLGQPKGGNLILKECAGSNSRRSLCAPWSKMRIHFFSNRRTASGSAGDSDSACRWHAGCGEWVQLVAIPGHDDM